MTDDNTNTDENTEPVHVEVDVPTEPVEPVAAPAVTVIDTGDASGGDAVDAVVLDHTIDNAERIADLERQLAEAQALIAANIEQTANVAATADVAVEVADAAHREAVEANTEEQAAPETDHVPNHEHPWFRTIGKRD